MLRLTEYYENLDPLNVLSYGQLRKYTLACALLGDPKVLILDDPTAAMDADSREEFYCYLKQIKLGRTIIMASSDLNEVEKLADRVCIMKDGNVLTVDKPSNILKRGNKIIIEPKRHLINAQEFKTL